jgi:hypothetical protein
MPYGDLGRDRTSSGSLQVPQRRGEPGPPLLSRAECFAQNPLHLRAQGGHVFRRGHPDNRPTHGKVLMYG